MIWILFTHAVLKNDTGASHYKNQLAGHFSLGSKKRRIKVQRLEPLSIQSPVLKADCSGIDVFLGGVNYIDTQEFIEFMKNVGRSAKSYAFALALETVSPQIATTLKYLTDMAQKVNLSNINSCEAAAALVGAVAPRTSQIHQKTCTLLSAQQGRITDWVAGKRKCGEAGKDETTRRDAAETLRQSHKDLMYGSYNVAWDIISKHTHWDTKLKETIMSITGTVVVIDGKVHIFPPMGLDDDFFNAFAEGGKTRVYTCSDSRCLTVKEVERTIGPNENHATQIRLLLESIESKIYSDTPLNDIEKNLIEECQVPILKIINIMSAYHRNESPINIQGYADIIAHDILNKHFKDILDIVRHLAANVKTVQMNAEPLDEFMKQVRAVQKKLHQKSIDTQNNIDQIFKIIEKTRVLERAIYADMRTIVKE